MPARQNDIDRPYALPLRIRKAAESFAVEDANGVALAYVPARTR
jgi:hypothetical protein